MKDAREILDNKLINQHVVLGIGGNINVTINRRNDAEFNKDPYVIVTNGSSETKISIYEPRYLDDDWKLNDGEKEEFNTIMNNGWKEIITESCIEAGKDCSKYDALDYQKLKLLSTPDYTKL